MDVNTIKIKVRIIIKKEDKVLLCFPKKDVFYFLPGGSVEYGDNFEETIYKEMNEELGFKREDITDISYVNYLEHMYKTVDKKIHHELNMIFSVKIPKNINIKSQENHIDFKWIDIKDIDNIKLLPEKIVPLIK